MFGIGSTILAADFSQGTEKASFTRCFDVSRHLPQHVVGVAAEDIIHASVKKGPHGALKQIWKQTMLTSSTIVAKVWG